MKKLKTLGTISFALIGGGALLSIPLAMTSCGKEKDVPKEFYKYSEDGSVLGWSDKVINDPSILKSYNTMNLHGEIINGNCLFARSTYYDSTDHIFNSWEVHKIDLSNTIWEPSVSGEAISTGFETFYYANLSHCSDLNLHGANFSRILSDRTTMDANCTFKFANLSSLKSLDLSETYFTRDIINQTPGTLNVVSAFECFSHANFSHLEDLNLGQIVRQPDETPPLDGTNYINGSIFAEITKNSKWQSSKLKITETGDYWETQGAELDGWFGSNGWKINH